MISPIKKNGIILGYIDTENKVYVSDRNRTHIFNLYKGLGISIKVLDLLQEKDINKIIIRMEGNELITTVSTFLVHGISYTDIDDKQLILPFEYFNKKLNTENQEVLI